MLVPLAPQRLILKGSDEMMTLHSDNSLLHTNRKKLCLIWIVERLMACVDCTQSIEPKYMNVFFVTGFSSKLIVKHREN